MKKKKIPNYPIEIVFARDWSLYHDQKLAKENFEVSTGYIVGFLIQEDKTKVVLAANLFTDGVVRETTVIPKETILFRKKLFLKEKENAKRI